MAKQNILTAAFVRNVKEPKLHNDGNGYRGKKLDIQIPLARQAP